MARVIALLRGVNVGGRKLAMSDLRALCEEAGCEEVKTYIQSGNVVFTHKGGSSERLRTDLERRIKKVAGYESPVMLRTAKELDAAVRGNPYKGASGTTLHVAFLGRNPVPRRSTTSTSRSSNPKSSRSRAVRSTSTSRTAWVAPSSRRCCLG
jgi:uncharacterized protein (DUF1697 family)